jgi:hypothetical protein
VAAEKTRHRPELVEADPGRLLEPAAFADDDGEVAELLDEAVVDRLPRPPILTPGPPPGLDGAAGYAALAFGRVFFFGVVAWRRRSAAPPACDFEAAERLCQRSRS